MDTLLVRLKPYEPRRGHVLKRFTYAGIKILEERGWHRVAKEVGEYLRSVKQVPTDTYSPLAFDVCTDDEAKALDVKEEAENKVRRVATDDIKLLAARGEPAEPVTSTPKPNGNKKER